MKSYSRGITIIEAIISIMITGFALVGMLRLYSLGAIQSSIVRHKVMAMNIAQAEIEGLINKGYETISQEINQGVYPKTQAAKIDTGKTGSADDDINGTMITSISSVTEGYKITATISWNDYYGPMSEIAASIVTSYL